MYGTFIHRRERALLNALFLHPQFFVISVIFPASLQLNWRFQLHIFGRVVEYYEAIFRAFISDVCLFSWDRLHNPHIENSPFGMTECIITNTLFHITSSGGTPDCFPIFQ